MFTPQFHIDRQHDSLSKDLRAALQRIGKTTRVQKSEIVMGPDTANDFFFYIERGIFKTIREVDDRQFILGFTFPGDVDGDPAFLLGQKKSDFSMVAITPADVQRCPWHTLEKELGREKYLATVSFFLARYTIVLQNRIIESLAETAEERYKQLVHEQPEHLNEIPVSDLASYLGITRQSLSRIRSSRL